MTPNELLEAALAAAVADPEAWDTAAQENRDRIDRVARATVNRACVRLVLSCMLAKVHQPDVDPRRPYTEIQDPGTFSGRAYDETHIQSLLDHKLPINTTTAFLTPALRNIDFTLTPDHEILGRPRELYTDAVRLLSAVANEEETAEAVLTDTLRVLVQIRDERAKRLASLQKSLRRNKGALPLSSERIIALVLQHLACQRSSRLPVLIVAAAYQCVSHLIGENPKPLGSHNSADEQSGAAGDVEICLTNDEQVRTVYEMKHKAVTTRDIDRGIEKVAKLSAVDNYIFITTHAIELEVREYAASVYATTEGIEFAVLDCAGFLRHFLHLFHRHRVAFLDAYQRLVLAEPESAVSFELQQAFLALREAALADPS
jgi:hypothetical protein